MAVDPAPAFVWGGGGAQMTPAEIEAQRKVAQVMMQKGMDYSPIQSPWQGAARVAQALLGGLESGEADRASKTNSTNEAALLSSIFGGGSATPAAPTVASDVAKPAGATAIPTTIADTGLTDAISKVAAARGVDPQYMTRLALVESGGNPNAASSLSSASGPFQFIKSTAQQYGLTNPNDPTASADAAARLTLDNKAALTQALGREPTSGELYLAHQQGAGGAAKLLSNPDAPVEAVIGAEAARNNGATPGMTAGQFANKWTGRFSDIGAPQTVDANAPSPLDNAAYPAGPVGAPGTQVAQAAPTPGPAAAPTPAATPAAPGVNPRLLAAMSSPYVSDGTKKILGLVLSQQMAAQQKAADPLHNLQIQAAQKALGKSDAPASVQEYEYYKEHLPDGQQAMDYGTWSTAKARAAATTITNNVGNGETSFQKEAGKSQASRFNDLASEGQQAKQMVSDLGTLTELGKNIGTGKGAQLKAAIGPYADALGVKVDGLSDIQAYEAIVNRVAPTLRVKGSGAQSDFELKNFLKALPSLGNTPEGNAIAATVMTGFQHNKVLAAEIASKAINNEITRAEADKHLRELPDPMIPYREYAKANKVQAKPAAPDKSAIEAEMKRRGLL